MEPAIIPYVDQHTGPKRVLDLVLTPQMAPLLEYRGPANLSRRGDLGAPGTTKSRGTGCQLLLILALLAVLVIVVLVVRAFLAGDG